jgi:hypothetical protein
MEKDIEQYFTAIKEDYNRLEEKVDKGFYAVNGQLNRLDDLVDQIVRTTATILEIVQTNDQKKKRLRQPLKNLIGSLPDWKEVMFNLFFSELLLIISHP